MYTSNIVVSVNINILSFRVVLLFIGSSMTLRKQGLVVKAFKENEVYLQRQGLKMKHRIYLFLLLLICGISLPSLSGLLVFPFSVVPTELTLAYTLILSVIFLSMAIFLRSRKSLKCYWQIFFAFFIASLAIFFDFLVNMPSGYNEWTSFRYVGKHFNNCKHDNSFDSKFREILWARFS